MSNPVIDFDQLDSTLLELARVTKQRAELAEQDKELASKIADRDKLTRDITSLEARRTTTRTQLGEKLLLLSKLVSDAQEQAS